MTQEPNNSDARFVDIELKLGFHQQAYDDLNSVVLRQQEELEELRREIARLKLLVQRVVEQGPGDDLPHEKPPHY